MVNCSTENTTPYDLMICGIHGDLLSAPFGTLSVHSSVFVFSACCSSHARPAPSGMQQIPKSNLCDRPTPNHFLGSKRKQGNHKTDDGNEKHREGERDKTAARTSIRPRMRNLNSLCIFHKEPETPQEMYLLGLPFADHFAIGTITVA